MKITSINPNDKTWTRQTFILSFGAYGNHHLYVHADHLEDALDECIDWIAENAPGLLMDEQVTEAYNAAIAEGKSEDEAREEAECDMTCGGNAGNYIASYEWSIYAENPTFSELRALVTA